MDKDIIFKRTAAFISNLHDLESSLSTGADKGNLTPLQHSILQILYFTNPKTLSALSECMNMNMPNTSREVKKLTELNLISKSQSENDKRITNLSLTAEGSAIIETGLNHMRDEFFRNTGSWSERRIKRFLESLDVLEQDLFSRKKK